MYLSTLVYKESHVFVYTCLQGEPCFQFPVYTSFQVLIPDKFVLMTVVYSIHCQTECINTMFKYIIVNESVYYHNMHS